MRRFESKEREDAKHRQARVELASAGCNLWLVLGIALTSLISGRSSPPPWMDWLGSLTVVGVFYMLYVASEGRADQRGVYWVGLGRRIPWRDITRLHHENGRWVVTTTRRTVRVPRWLTNAGTVAAEVRRRLDPTPPTPGAAEAELGKLLGLAPGQQVAVPCGPTAGVVQRWRANAPAALVLLMVAVWRLAVGDWYSAAYDGALLLLWLWIVASSRRHATAYVSEAGIECCVGTGAFVLVPWSQLVAVVDCPGGYVLQMVDRDVRIHAGSAEADTLRGAARGYLAARDAGRDWSVGPSSAALSPAARLTGDEERGLSQAEVSSD